MTQDIVNETEWRVICRVCCFMSFTLSPVRTSCSYHPLRGDTFPERCVKESVGKRGRYPKSESERKVNKIKSRKKCRVLQ